MASEGQTENRSVFSRLLQWVNNRLKLGQSRHLSKSVLLEESGSPMFMRITLILFIGLLLAFILWSFWTELDEVAIAQGEVIPSSNIIKVQHPIGGVVEKIQVEEGAFVEKGQTVIWMKSSDFEAQLAIKEIQRQSLQAQKDRHQLFLNQINQNLDNFNPKEILLSNYHQEILNSFKDFRKIDGDLLTSQIEQLKNNLGVLAGQEESALKKKDSLKKELNAREIMVLKEEATRVSLLNLKRQYEDVQNELTQIPLKCYKLLVDHQNGSLSEISRIENELAQVIEVISSVKDKITLSRIMIPVDGIVHNLQVHTIGEVIGPGKTVFQLVPREKDLKAEVQVAPKDIGHIAMGQKAVLKFTAYEVSNYGSLDGTITRLSPTTFIDSRGKPYYKATIQLDKGYVGDDPSLNLILPGMTLEADIRTGSKTVFQYLLKPIFKSGQQALRER